jgi:hypothetical protein
MREQAKKLPQLKGQKRQNLVQSPVLAFVAWPTWLLAIDDEAHMH